MEKAGQDQWWWWLVVAGWWSLATPRVARKMEGKLKINTQCATKKKKRKQKLCGRLWRGWLAKIEMVKRKTADNSCSIKSDGKRQQERKAGKIL